MVDKLIVTNRSALRKKYGTRGLAKITAAVNALIAADRKRDLTTRLIALDSVDGLQQRFAGEIGVAEPTLEEIFIHLTGRSLEDDEGGNE